MTGMVWMCLFSSDREWLGPDRQGEERAKRPVRLALDRHGGQSNGVARIGSVWPAMDRSDAV